jgi:hypothetical protein
VNFSFAAARSPLSKAAMAEERRFSLFCSDSRFFFFAFSMRSDA